MCFVSQGSCEGAARASSSSHVGSSSARGYVTLAVWGEWGPTREGASQLAQR
jgi:hypothetical protein